MSNQIKLFELPEPEVKLNKKHTRNKAQKIKNDEFYTIYEDIEAELKNYKYIWPDKVIHLPADTQFSNFYIYFYNNFHMLGLKKVIATCYVPGGNGIKVEYDGIKAEVSRLNGSGDFLSWEVLKISLKADLIITNPPFSLLNVWLPLLLEKDKRFIIIAPGISVGYKNIFHAIKNKKLFVGDKRIKNFWIDKAYTKKAAIGAIWLNNLQTSHLKVKELNNQVSNLKDKDYIRGILRVGKLKDIPTDYYKPLYVPVTFLQHQISPEFIIYSLNKDNHQFFTQVLIQRKYKGDKINPELEPQLNII